MKIKKLVTIPMALIFVNVPNLEIHLEEDHLEEIRMEDHHSIHLDWIIGCPTLDPCMFIRSWYQPHDV